MGKLIPKKGQATIFAIVGIVIVALIVMLFFLLKSPREQAIGVKKTVSFETLVDTTRAFVRECSQETLKDAVKTVATQGGYYLLPVEKKLDTPFGNTVFAYDKKKLLVTKDGLKKEILAHMQQLASRKCDFGKIKDVEVKTGFYSGNVLLSSSSVTIQQQWPIEVSRGESKTTIQDMTITFDTRLDMVHTFVQSLVEALDNDEKMHQMNLPVPEGMDVRVIEQDGYSLYVITDKQSLIDKKPLRYFFGARI